MPPEPLPWDRRDSRKHDRSAPDNRLGAGGGPHKWRRQQHDPYAPPPYNHNHHQQRWSSDFRSPRLLPPGHSKQGGWPMYSDDAGQGFMPPGTRFPDRNLENENCRPFGSRGDGRYFRNNRENRGSFTQKDWKAPSWEPAAVPNAPGEPMTEVNNLRPIDNTQPCHNRSSRSSYASHPPLGSVNQSDQSQSPSPSLSLVKEKNGDATDETTGEGQESEKENCLAPDLEQIKWSRVGNLSSRSSCISHSTSSKSLGLDSVEVLAEVQPKNSTLDQSPSVDVACVRSNAPARSDETGSRKKPRLGWGEGLAKYEKKKVEGPEEGSLKNEPALSSISTESPLSANLLEQSPGVECLLDCASPATPSSVACSSSPGVVEEKSVKVANVVRSTTNMSCFPSIASPGHYGGPILNLENLELQSIANLSSLINKMQQPNDPSSAETGYMQTTSINKLLLWKVDILKVLEVTESEIESLETELKSLKNEPGFCCSHSAGPRSLAGERQLNPYEELDTASIWHESSQAVSSGEITAKDAPVRLEGGHVLSTNEDIDSPGSATSKFVGVLPAIFLSEKAEFSEVARNVEIYNSGGLDKKCSKKVFSSQESPCYVNNLVPIGNTSLEDLVGSSKVYCNVNNLCSSILSSNRAAASRASEQLNKLLPKQCLFDGSIESLVSSSQRKSSEVMERFRKRKQFLQFKEKVLTLKFKVFQHFWKEGRLLSIRRLRGKTRKKLDPSRNGQKRNSRVSFYAGGPQAVRADEVINFVNDLLSEFAIKPYRNTLKMPALILDKQVKMSRFISKNGLVEDPCVVEKERSMMNPWTAEETYVFIEKLAAFGKDFRKIASFLDHKTVADCIEFYYKNHKSECFEKTRKDSGFLKQRKSQTTTYLVGSGKRRNPELNAASLDILGAASEIVAKIDCGLDIRQKCTSRSSFGMSSSCLAPRVADHLLKESDSMDSDNNERETEAADVLAGICGSLSSEGMSSSITSSADFGGGYQDPNCPRINPSKQSSTLECSQDVDVEYSDESCSELNPTDWSDEEKSIFMQAVSSFGKDFAMVSQSVGTKSMDQCKVFFGKARKCLGLDLIQPVTGTASGDDDGGSSEIVDGSTMETCSGISNNGYECKTEPGMNSSHESDMMNSGPDFKTSNGSNQQGPLDSMISEPVPENSSIVGGHVGDKPVADFNEHSKGQNATNVSFVPAQEPQTVTVAPKAPKMESEQGFQEKDDLGMPNGLNDVVNRPSVEVSGDTNRGISGKQLEPQLAGNLKIKYRKTQNHNLSWPNDASGTDDSHSQNFVRTGDSQQLLPSYSLSKSTESSQILQGYPVSLQAMVGGASGDASCENLNSDRRADLLLQKCKEARQSNAAFPSLERGRDHSRTQSGCSSTGENPPRHGDVKLFGKILSSSQQKPCNSVERVDDHRIHLEFSSDFRQQPKFGCNNHVPTENMPVRSFGFWDGNRIQTGTPPMPDSAFLLARYPAAFSNFPLPSLRGGGASVSRSISSNGVPDHREMQPQDAFAQMQRRSAFNVASGMQQHGRGMSGVHVAGRGGVPFGGQCSGVSDPVAAIKMHYARAEQLRMQGGNAVADDGNRWISNRDVGR